MKEQAIKVARIYVRESEGLLDKVVRFLRDESDVAGVTVLRAIEGFSEGGEVHSALLVALSLDLPLVIEFFDAPEKIESIVHSLVRRFPLRHIVTWQANCYSQTNQSSSQR